ncbi:MAG: GNAT family N-acetyltransferase [Terriglobales bacterium]
MKIRLARTAAEMDTFRPAWDYLHASAASATLFQSFAWNRLAAECFAGREQPHVIFAESDSGAAIIPAAINRGGLVLLGESLFDYRDMLSVGDEEPLHAAWAELASLQLPLHITALRGRPAAVWEELAPAPWVTAPRATTRDITADAFAAAHPRLGRYVRRLARGGVELHRRCGSAVALVRRFYRAKAAQFAGAPNNLFADPVRVDFMAAAAAMDPAACEIFTFEAGSRVVAGLVTFRDCAEERSESPGHTEPARRDVRRFYTVYFDRAWAHYSPGTALCFEVTRRSLTEGLDCDFMTGEQPHKRRLMTSSVSLFRIEATAEMIARAAHILEPATRLAA